MDRAQGDNMGMRAMSTLSLQDCFERNGMRSPCYERRISWLRLQRALYSRAIRYKGGAMLSLLLVQVTPYFTTEYRLQLFALARLALGSDEQQR